jgi:Zinc-ribbon containing domain
MAAIRKAGIDRIVPSSDAQQAFCLNSTAGEKNRQIETVAKLGDLTRSDHRRNAMAAHAGEAAEQTGDFRCERCHETTHVTKGHKIPKCPNYGNTSFDTRRNEP